LKRYISVLLIILNLEAGNKIDLWGIDLDSSQDNNQNIVKEIKDEKPKVIEKVKFEQDYDTAQTKAIDENRYIFLLVTEKSCNWCEKLKSDVLTDQDVAHTLNSNFISIEVDRDTGYYPYNIGIQGTPSIFILNPDDNHSIKSVTGYRDRDRLLEILNSSKR
jgi:thioredoxin-related protein